ncbi:MAG TPA: YceI family protein [Steroidobacteraceae bacterium]|jgi:polyisoprenoid-binding protein YceI
MKRFPKTPASVICAIAALAACSQQHEQSSTAAPAAAPAAITPAKVNVPAGMYTLDKVHSTLTFHLEHMGFSNYTARFTGLDAQLQFDPVNPTAAALSVTIDPRSLDLNNPPPGFKDTLLGPDWLDAAKYPQMTFRSTSVALTTPNAMRIEGELTLHGITHPVTLDATFNGGYAGQPLDPHARIGFSAHGSIKRSDFGIANGIPAPGTKMGVGDEVSVAIETELSGPAWSASA